MSGRLFTIEPSAFRAAEAAARELAPRVAPALALVATPPTWPAPGPVWQRPAPHHGLLLGVVLIHVVALWALLQITAVRNAVAEVAPMVVRLIAPPAPREVPTTPPPPPMMLPPPPLVRLAPPELTITLPVLPQTPTTAPVVVPTPAPPTPQPPVAVVAPVAPVTPAAPKILPASAVQYLGDPPVPEYPRLSIRQGETGRVMLRIYIDEAGLPRSVQVERSSGHPRLDEAALAAMRRARFKPYTENGQPVAGWAYVPLDFALER